MTAGSEGGAGRSEPPSNLTRHTIRQLSWSSLGTGVHFLASFATLMVLARILDPAEFGVMAAGLAIIVFAQGAGLIGLGPAIVRSPTAGPELVRVAFTLSVASGFALMGVVVLLAPAFGGFFRDQELVGITRVLALTLGLRGTAIVAEGLLQRQLRFKRLTGIQVVSAVGGYSLPAIGLGLMGFGAWSMALAQVIHVTFESALTLISMPHPKRPRLEASAARDLLRYSSGVSISRFGNTVGLNADNFIVGRYLGIDLLGVYSRAYRLMSLPANLFADAIDAVMLSSLSKVQETRSRLVASQLRGSFLMAVLMLPTSAVLLVVAPEVVRVVLGEQWIAAIVPFRILTLAAFLRMGRKLGATLASAVGAVHALALIQLLFAVVLVGSALVLWRFGLAGVCWAVDFSLLVMFAAVTRLSSRLLGVPARRILRPLVPGLALALLSGASAMATARPLRAAGVPDLLVMVTTALVAYGSAALVVWIRPAVLGPEGRWWLDLIGTRSRGRRSPWAGGRRATRARGSEAADLPDVDSEEVGR